MYTEIKLDSIDTTQLISELTNYIDEVDSNQTELAESRKLALQAYRGEYPGKEPIGSSFVSPDVKFAVNAVAPEIVKVFLSSKNPLKFVARDAQNKHFAEVITDYVSKSFEDHGGYHILQTFVRNALLLTTGVLKTSWVEKEIWTFESYEQLDEAGLAGLLQQEGVKPEGQPVQEPTGISVKVKRKSKEQHLKFESIPPENLLCSAETDRLDDCRFVSERNWVTKNELLDLGYDKDVVDELTLGQKDTAYSLDTDRTNVLDTEATNTDNDRIEYYESYLYYALKEDGPERKIKVCHTEDRVLAVYDFDILPYSIATATNVPNALYGMSLAEQVIPIQELKTVLLRQSANSVYLNNFPRQFVYPELLTPEGVKQFAEPKMGSVINVKLLNEQAINPSFTLPTTSNLSESNALIQQLDERLNAIMGVNPVAQGVASDVINNRSATEVAIAQSNADTALISYIRNIAEGLKDAFKKALWLALYYDTDDDIQYTVNDFNIDIRVGLGANDDQRQLQALAIIKQTQAELVEKYGTDSPFINEANIFATIREMAKLSGVDNLDAYIPDVSPEQVQQHNQAKQEQAMDAEQQAVMAQQQAQMALEQEKTAAKMAEIQLKREQLAFDIQKHNDEIAFKKDELAVKSEVELTTLEVNSSIEEARLDLKDAELKTEAGLKLRSIDTGQSTSTNIGIR